jgi:GGDEF domain-containing protein/predicted RNA methylase
MPKNPWGVASVTPAQSSNKKPEQTDPWGVATITPAARENAATKQTSASSAKPSTPPSNAVAVLGDEYARQLRANFAHNQPYAKSGPYFTQLPAAQEKQFRQWVAANNINFDPDAKIADYDMRGFWLARQNGKAPRTAINEYDNKLHFTDKFKTPYDRTFSNESRYAKPDAPHWVDGRYLVTADGRRIFDQAHDTEDSPYPTPAKPSLALALPHSSERNAPIAVDLSAYGGSAPEPTSPPRNSRAPKYTPEETQARLNNLKHGKRIVPVGEDVYRHVASAASNMEGAVALLGMPFATAADTAYSLATGEPTSAAADWYAGHAVKPLFDSAKQIAIDPHHEQETIAGQVLGTAAAMGVNLAPAIMTGGVSGALEAAPEVTALAAANGFSIPVTIERFNQLVGAGVDYQTAAKVAAKDYGINTVMGLVPASKAGKPLTRFVTGAPVGPLAYAAQTKAERDSLNRQYPRLAPHFEWKEAGRSGLLTGAMGLLFGARAKLPAGAESKPINAEELYGKEEADEPPDNQGPPPNAPEISKNDLIQQAKARLSELEERANGAPDRRIPGPNGKMITVRGKQPQFFTSEAEQAELRFLRNNADNADALARVYGLRIREPNAGTAEPAQNDILRYQFDDGRQIKVQPLDEATFVQYVRPRLKPDESGYSLSEYRAAHPDVNAVALARAPGRYWQLVRLGNQATLKPTAESLKSAREVTGFAAVDNPKPRARPEHALKGKNVVVDGLEGVWNVKNVLGRDNLALLESPDGTRRAAKVDQLIPVVEAPADKRVNEVAAKRVVDMSGAEKDQALLTDTKTGIGNDRAFRETGSRTVGIADLDGLKYVNDTFGHHAGDALIQAAADALDKHSGGRAYRLHGGGDEFAVRAESRAEAQTALDAANEALGKTVFHFERPDGRHEIVRNLGFSYGTGKNEAIADRRLGEHKDTRTRQGLRSARGEAPSGDMGAPAQGHEGVDGAAGRDDGGSGREALDYFDPRLKRADYREALKVDARELTPGGNMGLIGGSFSRDFDPAAYDRTPRDQEAPVQRLPSTNPDWFQQLASEEGVSVKQVQNAIDKALAGDQLGKRQQRIVTGLLDGYEAERTEPERLNQRRRQLEQARQLRQSVKDKGGVAAKGSDFEAESEWARYIDNHPGEALAEGEYDPSLDGEARALQELQKEAEKSEPDAVETLVDRLALGKLSEPAAARELWAIIENARRSHENTDARRSGDQGLPRQTAGHVAEPERREAVSENDARSENRPSREVAQRNETAAPAAAEETPLTPPERSSLELSPAEQRAPVEKAPDTEQTDLIGGKTETQQAVYDETLRRDRARNSGQLETETGDASDLFSQARQQTDLTDYPPPESESQPAETAPSKEGVVVSGKRSSESAPKEAESIPVDAGRQPVPGRTLVKRWAGARGSGFTEASARIERRKRARAEPQFDWDVAALEGEPGRYVVRAFEQKPARTGVSASGARPSNKAEAPLPPQREYTRDVATEMRPTGSESEATPAASGVTETAPTDAAYYYVNGELGLARTGCTRDESRWITFTPDEARRMAAGDITPHGGGQRHGVFVGVDSGRRMPSEPAILNNSSDTGADNGGTTEQLRPVGPAAHDRASAEALPGDGEKRDVRPGDEGQAGTGRAGDAQSRRGRLQSRHGVGSGEEPLSDAGAGSQRHGSEPGAGREPHRPSDQDVVADAESGAGGLRAGERVSNAGNYVITDADALGAGGAKTHADQNLAAIKILKALESRGARATPEEQAVLVKYTGWGGLPQIFDEAKGDWAARRDQLKSLVTDEEYAAARRSTQDAHYTSADVIRAIYAALDRLGVQGGRVLEPAVGTGHFFGLMPKKLRARTRLTGIELDPITGGIAKLLYPKAGINAPLAFQDAKLPDGAFDLALGNPPFGSNKITDRLRKHLSGQSIHNYFFGKSVDTLADDGVLAMVVSHHLMDKADSRDRAALAKRTRLLGAIRLPETAFKANAGTEVTTDIIILQKRKPDEDAGEAWTAVATVDDPAGGEPIPVNEYFARHPEMMAGEMARKGTMYGPDQPTLLAKDDRTLAGVLEGIVQKLPEHAVKPLGDLEAKRPAVPEKRPALQLDDLDASDIKPYSFFELPDGRIAQRDPDTEGLDADGNIVTEQHWHVREGWVDKKAERARRLIKLHQSARRLLTL